MRKIKITKKKKKAGGLVWKPRNISSIYTMLQWNRKGGEKFIHGKKGTGMGAEKIWGETNKKKTT